MTAKRLEADAVLHHFIELAKRSEISEMARIIEEASKIEEGCSNFVAIIAPSGTGKTQVSFALKKALRIIIQVSHCLFLFVPPLRFS